MSEQENKKGIRKKLHIQLSEETGGVYSNLVIVNHNETEFVLILRMFNRRGLRRRCSRTIAPEAGETSDGRASTAGHSIRSCPRRHSRRNSRRDSLSPLIRCLPGPDLDRSTPDQSGDPACSLVRPPTYLPPQVTGLFVPDSTNRIFSESISKFADGSSSSGRKPSMG